VVDDGEDHERGGQEKHRPICNAVDVRDERLGRPLDERSDKAKNGTGDDTNKCDGQ